MMLNAIGEVLLQAGVVLLLACVIAVLAPKAFRAHWLAVAVLLVIFHDALLLRLYGLIPDVLPGRWNWSGKLLATLGMLGMATWPRIGWRNSGLTFQQASGSSPAWLMFGAISVVVFTVAIALGDGRADWETILFQWTMPGIQEEIFYRGVLLLALNEAFTARARVLGAEIGWGGLLATVAFGLIHSLFYGSGGISFDMLAFSVTAGPALVLLWFRERTGSVVLPVLAHNVANGAFVLF